MYGLDGGTARACGEMALDGIEVLRQHYTGLSDVTRQND